MDNPLDCPAQMCVDRFKRAAIPLRDILLGVALHQELYDPRLQRAKRRTLNAGVL